MSQFDDPYAMADDSASRQAELRQTRLEVNTRDSLKKPYVRALLQEIIIACGYYDQTPFEDRAANRAAGKRDIALWLRDKIGKVDFEMLHRMETEAAVAIPDPRERREPDDE